MKKLNAAVLFTLTLLIMAGCSQSFEESIVGTWHKVDGSEQFCDTNMDNKLTFKDDGGIVGIEGFKTYEIQKSDNKDYDYAVLSGGYEDNTRYRVKIDEDNHLQIVKEEDDKYDFDSAISCSLEKKG